jgi:hypothetical protein
LKSLPIIVRNCVLIYTARKGDLIINKTICIVFVFCGVHGNEQADRLAKNGAGQQQQENPACLTEMKTIIKSLFKIPQQDSYHQLTRSDQTTIFRLRTGHNSLNQHLNMNIIPSPMCSCGEAEQDTAHILQTCKNHQALREEIWPLPKTLQKTTRFLAVTEIQV